MDFKFLYIDTSKHAFLYRRDRKKPALAKRRANAVQGVGELVEQPTTKRA